jgi:hypothetical protein
MYPDRTQAMEPFHAGNDRKDTSVTASANAMLAEVYGQPRIDAARTALELASLGHESFNNISRGDDVIDAEDLKTALDSNGLTARERHALEDLSRSYPLLKDETTSDTAWNLSYGNLWDEIQNKFSSEVDALGVTQAEKR